MLKAIPTTYRGIEFRSKLEAKYAQAFDRLGIVWEYEGHGFAFDDGTWYCPDFYMPEIDTYFEVKGVMDEASERKVKMLAEECKWVVVGGPDGTMTLYEGWRNSDGGSGWVISQPGETHIGKCSSCGRYVFWGVGSYECHSCHGYDGNPCTEGSFDDPTNLFEAAGWERGW